MELNSSPHNFHIKGIMFFCLFLPFLHMMSGVRIGKRKSSFSTLSAGSVVEVVFSECTITRKCGSSSETGFEPFFLVYQFMRGQAQMTQAHTNLTVDTEE